MARKLIDVGEYDRLVKAHGIVKVNLAEDVAGYAAGNGEGIWAVPATAEDAAKARDDGSRGDVIQVYAANDSFYYPGDIVCRSLVVCETRGSMRPMALWDDLHGTGGAPKRAAAIKRKLLKGG